MIQFARKLSGSKSEKRASTVFQVGNNLAFGISEYTYLIHSTRPPILFEAAPLHRTISKTYVLPQTQKHRNWLFLNPDRQIALTNRDT